MYSGVVDKTTYNEWQGKKLYAIKLSGDNEYYNTGEVVPPVQPGQFIEFSAKISPKGRKNVDVKSIVVKQGVPTTQAPVLPVSGTADKDAYWDAKGKRDVIQDRLRAVGASRNTAIELVKFMIANEAIPLPKLLKDREAFLLNVVDKYTTMLVDGDISTKKEVKVEVEQEPEEKDWK